MKSIYWLLLIPMSLFSQTKIDIENQKKVEKIISLMTTIEEIQLLKIIESDFDSIFRFIPNISPINKSYKISSNWSDKRLHPLFGGVKKHNGVDIVAPENTIVYAAASGIVEKASFFNGNAGHSVTIKHKYGFKTKYFHLNLFIVNPNEKVKKGQIIGFLGSTGASTAPHLHYEVWKNEKVINPKKLLR